MCGCRNSSDYEREEEGPVSRDIEAGLTRNLFEYILYFYGEIWGIPENVPRFLNKRAKLP